MQIKGTELFVKALKSEGVDLLFGYPGGNAVDLFDALYNQEDIQVVLPRHEQGLIHAADGYARSTGRTGVCLVTSGPGATNLITGIATANYDCVPMVCFTGQVPMALIGNDAFQEVDIIGITRSICKYGVTVRDRKDLGRIIKEAFYIAGTGKPGPVIVDIPKDVQLAMGDDCYPDSVSIRGYKPPSGVHMGQIKKVAGMLEKAEKPLFLAGGGVNVGRAGKEFTALIDQTGIPSVTTIMGKGSIPARHPLYFGNLGMHGSYCANKAISECDLLVSVGTRFNDRVTSRIESFAPHAKIIHIDIDTASISKNIIVDVPIVADAKAAVFALSGVCGRYERQEWIDSIRTWEKETPLVPGIGSGLTPYRIIREINDLFEEAIVVTDVGQHQMWTTQYLQMDERYQLLTSGGLGGMGYGLPAAMGAKLGNPDRPVICISGDGGAQMNIQELATAVSWELPIIFCIFNNIYLGMVRQIQQLFFDKRFSSTCCRRRKGCDPLCKGPNGGCPKYTPDFVRLAQSYDAYGIRVEREDEIQGAFQQAIANRNAPTIIEFMIDSDELVLPMVPGGKPLTQMITENGR